MKDRIDNIISFVLNGITWLMGITFLVAACALDSESYIPIIACLVSALWFVILGVFAGLFNKIEKKW